jgi:hypothetical protein
VFLAKNKDKSSNRELAEQLTTTSEQGSIDSVV